MSEAMRPKVGIGVMVLKDGKVLLAKRKSALERGTYCWPGGHLEYMESLEECARREVREETGMEIANVRFLRVANLKIGDKHYVDIAFAADWASGEPELREPDKFEDWRWYDLDQLPSPLFFGEDLTLDALRTGRDFYDT